MQDHSAQPFLFSHVFRLPTPTITIGSPAHDVIYFLPWRTPYVVARGLGLLPLPFAACFATPSRAVSANPAQSVVTFRQIIANAERLIHARQHQPPPLIVGLSLGNVAATYIANAFGAPLLSICGASRGEDLIWDSPSTAAIRAAAERGGYQRAHYFSALDPLNPAENLFNLGARSMFVVGCKDAIIPPQHNQTWMRQLAEARPHERVVCTNHGHVITMLRSRKIQKAWYQSCKTARDCRL